MRIHSNVASMALALSMAAVAFAQTPPGNISRVTRYTVKPDRVADFQTGLKEMHAAMRKVNFDRTTTVWVSASGPLEYSLVSYASKWADLEGGPISANPKLKEVSAQVAAIAARLNQCVDKRETIISEVQTDLSLPRTGQPPVMARVLRTRVRPEKVTEYTALVKSDVLPAQKKAGAKLYFVMRSRFGAGTSEYTSVTALNGWADLDSESPLVKAMGADGYQRFMAKLRPLIYASEVNIYRYRADLSYLPGAPASSGGN